MTKINFLLKLTAFFGLFLPYCLFAQYQSNRYNEPIFDLITFTSNIKYGAAPKWTIPYNDEDLFLNVYLPENDTLTKRPLIIFAHSGGFLNGDKDCDDMVALCDSFAKRGYVTSTINYRMGFNPLSDGSAERAVYRGIQDGKAAVRFFKEKADEYGIDTNYIFFGGMSAGGFMSLHVAFMDKESERPESTYGNLVVNDLGCLDCAGNSYPHSSKVRAILDYWGAVQDTTIIEPGDNIPTLIMHGQNDPTVPFKYGHPFGVPTLPNTYGGFYINQRMNDLGMDHEYYTSTSNLHMLDGSENGTWPSGGPNAFWHDTLIPRTNDFLYRLVRPLPQKLTASIDTCMTTNFALNVQPDGIVKTYEWLVPNELTVLQENAQSIQLNAPTEGTFEVGYLQVNQLLAYSDTIWFPITITDCHLGLEPIAKEDLRVFPNPTTQDFIVESSQLSDHFQTYRLTDLMGRVLQQGNINENQLQLSLEKERNGIYLLMLDGKQQRILKIIKR